MPDILLSLPRITIALCTYNGGPHLQEQLDSYLAQDHTEWDLWVSDDGSTDDTLAILEQFHATHSATHRIQILKGPGIGQPAANFLSLLCHPDFPDTPTALSDQDDVWHPNKLSRALMAMRDHQSPCLYGGQSHYTDANLTILGTSRKPARGPSFQNAITENIVSGHSATLNTAALKLVRSAGIPKDIPYHDWWLYQVISAAGGHVVIDDHPVVLYRQHRKNVMGAHRGLGATAERFAQLFNRTYSTWIETNLTALAQNPHLLTEDARTLIEDTLACATNTGLQRCRRLHALGVHRQAPLATVAFYLAVLLKRV